MFQLLRKTLFLGGAKGDKDIPFILTLFFEQVNKRCCSLVVHNNGETKFVTGDFYLSTVIDDILPDVVKHMIKVNNELYHHPDYRRLIIKELKWVRSFIYVGTGVDLIGGDFDYILKVGVNEFINELIKISRDMFNWKYKGEILQPVKPNEEITVVGPFNDEYDPKKEEVKLLSTPMLLHTEIISEEKNEFYLYFRQGSSVSKVLLSGKSTLSFMITFSEAIHKVPSTGEYEENYIMKPVSDWDAGTTAKFCKSGSNSGLMGFSFNKGDLIMMPGNKDVINEFLVLLGMLLSKHACNDQITKERLS